MENSNRIIKFRAWDKTKKVMVGVETIYQYGIEVRDKKGKGWFIEEEFELMQFTGLLDRHGKDIYEGDIIDFDYPMAVIWDMGSWAVKTNKGSSLLYGYTTDGEIIGNIYENPELLK